MYSTDFLPSASLPVHIQVMDFGDRSPVSNESIFQAQPTSQPIDRLVSQSIPIWSPLLQPPGSKLPPVMWRWS